MLMAVLEGRAPNPRPHHAVEVTVTPFSQPRMKATCGPRGAPQGRKIYVHSINMALDSWVPSALGLQGGFSSASDGRRTLTPCSVASLYNARTRSSL